MEASSSSTVDKKLEQLTISEVTPAYVRSLRAPTEDFLCKLRDNELMRFGQYRLKNADTDDILLHITQEVQDEADKNARKLELENEEAGLASDKRTIMY